MLVVDDEPSLLAYEKELLTLNQFEVTAEIHSPEAIETFRKTPAQFDLLITD